MTRRTTVAGIRVRRGKKLSRGKGWRLVAPAGKRALKASLLKILRVGDARLAIFRVF